MSIYFIRLSYVFQKEYSLIFHSCQRFVFLFENQIHRKRFNYHQRSQHHLIAQLFVYNINAAVAMTEDDNRNIGEYNSIIIIHYTPANHKNHFEISLRLRLWR